MSYYPPEVMGDEMSAYYALLMGLDEDPEVVSKTIACLEEWWQAIVNRTANLRLPDPTGTRYDEERTNKVIAAVQDYFELELRKHPGYHEAVGEAARGVPMDTPLNFELLEGASREAFVQDIKEAAGR